MDSKETGLSRASQCDKKPSDNSSYEDDSFETAEESIRSSHSSGHSRVRRESVFLAESSTSSEESQESAILGQTKSKSYESTPRLTATDSASTCSAITEEQDYSDQFESTADNFSEVGSSIKDESISEPRGEEIQENFIRKKLAILSSRQDNSKTQICKKKDEDKEVDGYQQVNNFCSRKLKIVELGKQQPTNYTHSAGKRIVSANGGHQRTSLPIYGNKRKIESLRIENLMKETEKLKEQEFHNPRHCNDCRKMKSNIANNTFLKRKLDIVKRGEFEERLQIHMCQKDSVTLLAEIVTSCTKATVPASEVWEKLLHRGDKMITGNGCT